MGTAGSAQRNMSVSTQAAFESGHTDQIHDCQYDYYGRRVATCSSDRTIKVFDVAGETQTLLANLTGHDGPVWMCAWAHPKFGTLLASCSFDHKVIIWKESEQGVFSAIYTSPATLHDASVNAIAWAPHEFGLSLACASSDGCVSVITHRADGTWDAQKIQGAHSIGCTSVSWAPAPPPGSLVAAGGASATPVKRLVTGGCDNLAKIWRFDPSAGWKEEHQLRAHGDWVRDVCWSVNMGLPMNTIASCGQDNIFHLDAKRTRRRVEQDVAERLWRAGVEAKLECDGKRPRRVGCEQHGDGVEGVRGRPMEPDFRHGVRLP